MKAPTAFRIICGLAVLQQGNSVDGAAFDFRAATRRQRSGSYGLGGLIGANEKRIRAPSRKPSLEMPES
jgi:hypothetical protein